MQSVLSRHYKLCFFLFHFQVHLISSNRMPLKLEYHFMEGNSIIIFFSFFVWFILANLFMIQQGIGSLWANGAQTAGDHPSFFRLKHLRIITTHSGWDMLVHCRVPPISISLVSVNFILLGRVVQSWVKITQG